MNDSSCAAHERFPYSYREMYLHAFVFTHTSSRYSVVLFDCRTSTLALREYFPFKRNGIAIAKGTKVGGLYCGQEKSCST